MSKYERVFDIESNLEDVKIKLEGIVDQLMGFVKSEDLIFDLRLILNELVLNGVIHGNNLEDNRKVQLKILLDDKDIKINVKDEGIGFEYDKSTYDPFNLKSSGRGLLIVDGLSDELHISNDGVSIVKHLS